MTLNGVMAPILLYLAECGSFWNYSRQGGWR